MKKIYTFTLDSEDYPSDKFRYNLRLIAYLLYDSIYNYDGEGFTALNVNKNITYNDIHEGYKDSYYMDSDLYDDGYINYEPFIVGDRTFGLTINDEMMSENLILELLNDSIRLARLDYRVLCVNSLSYPSNNINDERYRSKALEALFYKLNCKVTKRVSLVKKLVNSNKYRNRLNVCGR